MKMTTERAKQLALDLLHADSEQEVIDLLQEVGFWEDEASWRYYSDDENNFRIIGSQQAKPEASLVEKLVNSVDARLMGACFRGGIKPDSEDAPQTIKDAREQFFGASDRTQLAKEITLAVTGARAQQDGMPCLTICDTGEGQTPNNVPQTFLSLDRNNKLRIYFVQGKFNMGGTGALMFCGTKKLQLIITRRDPQIVSFANPSDSSAALWSFVVVRRESPRKGPGQVRNPYFKYLAPVNATEHPGRGDVLTFEADKLPLMPDGNQPYVRSMAWGSCVKLYEYDMRGFKGHVLRRGGLLQRLEILLTEVAHPIRVHECRKGLRGHGGSFDTNLIGLRDRLENSKGDNLEVGYPTSLTLRVHGQAMTAKLYAFGRDRADSYRTDQGVVFTINGQTHGSFPRTFFERSRVKMGRLARSLLVIVDCTEISDEARADLFKNTRDRLSGGELRKAIEEELETQIANHPGLRELRERRRQKEVAEKLGDSKPLEDVIGSILKTSPSLSSLFHLGTRLSRPYKQDENGANGGEGGSKEGGESFHPRKHPTFFRFKKLREGELLKRTSEHGRRARFKFVTDVENEYFVRDSYRGRYHVEVVDGALEGHELTTSINLYNGVANWNVAIPEEDVAPGDNLTLQFTVTDDVIPSSLSSVARVHIVEPSTHDGGGGKRRGRSGSGDKREGGSGKGADGDELTGITLPDIKKVRRDGWDERGFDEFAACTVVDDGEGDDKDAKSSLTFYVNVDNLYLLTDLKQTRKDPELLQAKFIFGNVLVGLALVHEEKRSKAREGRKEKKEKSISEAVEEVTRALAPFMLPMIENLGGLEESHVTELAAVGDED